MNNKKKMTFDEAEAVLDTMEEDMSDEMYFAMMQDLTGLDPLDVYAEYEERKESKEPK